MPSIKQILEEFNEMLSHATYAQIIQIYDYAKAVIKKTE